MDKNNCIFCKIIKKEIEASIIYEDEKSLVFLDIKPVTKGHSLLIPKVHYEWIHETPDEIIAESFIKANKIIKAMRKGLDCDYVQVVVVGKDVPHLHIHLIPRYLSDESIVFQTTNYENEDETLSYSTKIKNALL
ncbi:MAG: HIT family protein [Candidatus Pacebacteria bacterium]|nr:HIT family protein [Candidatus Paceibacterota bacterium]